MRLVSKVMLSIMGVTVGVGQVIEPAKALWSYVKELRGINDVLIICGVYLIASQHASLTMFLITAVLIAIVSLIAQVLMYVALYRLGNDFNVGYLTAGIIILIFTTVLSVIPLINVVGCILGLVSFILMLVGLNKVKNKIEVRITPR